MSWNFFDSWKAKRISEKNIECTAQELEKQGEKCKKTYEDWEECVDLCGFNDPVCRGKKLEKYYQCVIKLNRMRTYLEDIDLQGK